MLLMGFGFGLGSGQDFCTGSDSDAGCTRQTHTFCIIGGGPGGIQLGHLFLDAGDDYVVFERAVDAQHASALSHLPLNRTITRLSKVRCMTLELSMDIYFMLECAWELGREMHLVYEYGYGWVDGGWDGVSRCTCIFTGA